MANSYIDIALLRRYVQGELDAAQMHEVEKAALDDVFVQEALDGMYYAGNAAGSYSLLQKRLHERTVENRGAKKHNNIITWPRLAIGSAAAVVCVLGTLLFTINRQKQWAGGRAGRTERHVEVALQDTASPQVADAQPSGKGPVQTDIINAPTTKVAARPAVVAARAPRQKAGWALPKYKGTPATAPQVAESTTATEVANAVREAPAYANTSDLPAPAGTMAVSLPKRGFAAKSMAQKRSIGAEPATFAEAGNTAVQINPRIEGTLNRSLAVPNAGLATIMLQQNRGVVNAPHISAPVGGWSSFFTTLSRQVSGSYPVYVVIQTDTEGHPVITEFAPGTRDDTKREFAQALTAAGLWHYLPGAAGTVKLWFNF